MDCRGDSNSICTNGDPIEWTTYNKPKKIFYTDNGRLDHSEFEYGPDRSRIRHTVQGLAGLSHTYYIDSHFEREYFTGGEIRNRSYLFANGKAVYELQENKWPNSCGEYQYAMNEYFFLRDHQGSVDKIVYWLNSINWPTSYSYDAFGKRRNTDWTPDDADALLSINHVTERGYTGHEHLDRVRLIHMNGRVQDPILGAMISADPIIGFIDQPQTLNRYAYVANNPLTYTDPSGFTMSCGSDSDMGANCTITAPRGDKGKAGRDQRNSAALANSFSNYLQDAGYSQTFANFYLDTSGLGAICSDQLRSFG